jgi:hypothetical protein
VPIATDGDVDSSGLLTGRWMHIDVVANGTVMSALGGIVQGPASVGLAHNDVTRSWRSGEMIELDVRDCMDIGITITFYGKALGRAVLETRCPKQARIRRGPAIRVLGIRAARDPRRCDGSSTG